MADIRGSGSASAWRICLTVFETSAMRTDAKPGSVARKRAHNGGHYRRADCISQQVNVVSSRPVAKLESRRKPHSLPKLTDLQHPHLVATGLRADNCKSIERGDSPKWDVKALPPACTIGTVVDQKKRSPGPDRSNGAPGAR
jgi:hypothetical protein